MYNIKPVSKKVWEFCELPFGRGNQLCNIICERISKLPLGTW